MSLPAVSSLRRRISRLVVLALFLGAGGALYWYYLQEPVETEITFVLTAVEVPAGAELLRHEHIRRLTCAIMDASGGQVGHLVVNRPGPVTKPPAPRLQPGEYSLVITLAFVGPRGTTKTRSYLKTVELKGEPVSLQL